MFKIIGLVILILYFPYSPWQFSPCILVHPNVVKAGTINISLYKPNGSGKGSSGGSGGSAKGSGGSGRAKLLEWVVEAAVQAETTPKEKKFKEKKS